MQHSSRLLCGTVAVLVIWLLWIDHEISPTGFLAPHYHGMTLARDMMVPPLLKQLFVVISFHWNVEKLVYLGNILTMIQTYETAVDVVIITDNYQALKKVLETWGQAENPALQVRQAHPDDPVDANIYSILWSHRELIEEQLPQADYTSVVYMEDDTRLSWPALISWALDTEVLEPLNFTRCMFRTEVDHKIGRTNILDWMVPVQLRDGNTLRVVATPAYKQVTERLKKSPRALCGHLRNGSSWPCQVHQQYVSPGEPFQGMWMASRRQLASFMAHPYWKKEAALNATIPVRFGYPERSNGMNILVNVPSGYLSNCMVPLICLEGKVEEGKSRTRLAPIAEVEHMRNGYSKVPGSWFAQMDVQAALKDPV